MSYRCLKASVQGLGMLLRLLLADMLEAGRFMVRKGCAAAVATSRRSACLYARHLQTGHVLLRHPGEALCNP